MVWHIADGFHREGQGVGESGPWRGFGRGGRSATIGSVERRRCKLVASFADVALRQAASECCSTAQFRFVAEGQLGDAPALTVGDSAARETAGTPNWGAVAGWERTGLSTCFYTHGCAPQDNCPRMRPATVHAANASLSEPMVLFDTSLHRFV